MGRTLNLKTSKAFKITPQIEFLLYFGIKVLILFRTLRTISSHELEGHGNEINVRGSFSFL